MLSACPLRARWRTASLPLGGRQGLPESRGDRLIAVTGGVLIDQRGPIRSCAYRFPVATDQVADWRDL